MPKMTLSSIIPSFSQELEEFLSTKQSSFRVIHTVKSSTALQSTSGDLKVPASTVKSLSTPNSFVILDSSFNPPHNGHFSLVQKFYEYHMKTVGSSKPDLLMLLSINNADKSPPNPQELERRLSMIYLLARHTSKDLGIDVSIALTTQAKFVDKSISIFDSSESLSKLTYLLGFDTIIRFFEERYYKPKSLFEALDDFMGKNELFCLTRGDCELKHAKEFQQKIALQCSEKWNENIIMVEGDASVRNISSSFIRKNILDGNTAWEDLVIAEIKNYITDIGMYSQV
ncbi:hypothetical protein WICPIJ_006442 [Wickerhamomyces pijperi]|uniref:Nicotinamide-nucleotide adenylyltransferase n=1 Tax=Wickerhamomyces pijperi TaxID=599730 RepID=A0A9P8TKV5_WICPI|nr:hypothetical protein WICPIJ_006442 [Wickerhamomyces pijperi]